MTAFVNLSIPSAPQSAVLLNHHTPHFILVEPSSTYYSCDYDHSTADKETITYLHIYLFIDACLYFRPIILENNMGLSAFLHILSLITGN